MPEPWPGYSKVHSYLLRYGPHPDCPASSPVRLYLKCGERWGELCLPAEDAVFVADLLRKNKPVYYNEKKKVLATGQESVGGEEESGSPHE